MNKVLVILNPAARGERARSMKAKIEALSPHAVVRLTESAGDAEAMAERGVQQGYGTIVAAGGDGTVNEVVNGLGESDVRLGILPVGTMNVFAAELGIPSGNLGRAWQTIEEGHIRRVDLPQANGDFFVQLAGVGLDAEVVRQTTPDSKKALGPISYILSLVGVAARKPPKIRVVGAGGEEHEGCFLLVGNGRFYGGPFVLFRDALLDDGLLDVLVFKNQSHWDVIRYLQAVAFGSHVDLPDVEYFQTPALTVTGDDDVPVEVDGELAGSVPYEFGFSKSKLQVLVPPAAKKS